MPDRSDIQHLMRFQARDAVFVHAIDKDAGPHVPFQEVNDVACDLLGYSRKELLDLTLADVFAHNAMEPARLEQLSNEGFCHFERTLLTKNGLSIPVEINAHKLMVDGQFMSVTIAHDISERKHIEEERVLNEQRFKALYQLSQMFDASEQEILDFALEEGVRVTKSAIGYIYLMNEEETELTLRAWSRDVMQQCAIEPDSPYCFNVADSGLWGDAARQRKPVITNDYPNHPAKKGQPEGHLPITRHMNLPIIDDGRITLIAGVGNKEEEYTESDVVQLSLLMEGMWRMIQRKRTEKDLVRARQAAEKAIEIKSQFLANMSHELRTPLNGIMGMTQILLSTDLSDDQKEYLSLSLAASRHLAKVLTDLLALSSIESGGIELSETDFNLHHTLEALVKPLSLQAASKSLILSLDIAPDVPSKAHGDAGKLRQVLINLLFNAIKFTCEGEVALEVSMTKTPCGHNTDLCEVRFAVIDTGIGIPEDQQQSIFESFTLGEDYMTKQYGGMGLGLSISRQLTTIMDGRIDVRSTPGKGSTFTVTLPLTMKEAADAISAAQPTWPEQIGALNILLAEDEQVNSIMASRLLRKAGHTVTIVGNGQQAIDALSANRFDLVLMDVQMPVVNGIQATEIIRSGAVENVPKALPIIGLTAFARNAEKQHFMDIGMQQIVTKPYEADELFQAIARTMNG